MIYSPIESEARLASSVHLHQGSGVDYEVMVDAHSGEILTSINQVFSADVKGSGLEHWIEIRPNGSRKICFQMFRIDPSKILD